MGKAKHPHNTKRPTSQGVLKALASEDTEMLKLRLTPRQRAFCHEYLVDFNATAATIRAGYAPVNAAKQAYLLKMNKGVSAYIDHLTKSKQAKLVSISPDYLIQRLTEIMNDETTKPADRIRTIELCMRHLGMFIERTELTGKDGGAIEVENRRIEQDAEGFLKNIKNLRDRAEKENPSIN